MSEPPAGGLPEGHSEDHRRHVAFLSRVYDTSLLFIITSYLSLNLTWSFSPPLPTAANVLFCPLDSVMGTTGAGSTSLNSSDKEKFKGQASSLASPNHFAGENKQHQAALYAGSASVVRCVLAAEGYVGFFLFSIIRLRPCDRIPVSVGLRDAFISILSRFDTSLSGLMENDDELKFNACPTAKRHILLIYFYYFSNRIVANREEENKNLLLHPPPFFFSQ